MKILIVEDDPTFRNVLKTVLETDYEITEAGSIKDCKELLKNKYVPNLVLLDIKLPNGSGRALFNDFMALQPQPVIIVCSGYVDEVADLYKPFSVEELLETIRTGLKEVQE